VFVCESERGGRTSFEKVKKIKIKINRHTAELEKSKAYMCRCVNLKSYLSAWICPSITAISLDLNFLFSDKICCWCSWAASYSPDSTANSLYQIYILSVYMLRPIFR
jgi:hypothetical protein